LQRDASAGRHARPFHALHRARLPGDAAAVREAVREEVRAGWLSEGSAGHGARAAAALWPYEARGRIARTRSTRRSVRARTGWVSVVTEVRRFSRSRVLRFRSSNLST